MRLFTVEAKNIIPGIRVNQELLGLVLLPGADVLPFMDVGRCKDPSRPPCTDKYPEVVDERVLRADLTTLMRLTLEPPKNGGYVVQKPESEADGDDILVLWRMTRDWEPMPHMERLPDETPEPDGHTPAESIGIVSAATQVAVLIRMHRYSVFVSTKGGNGALAMLGICGEAIFLHWDGERLWIGENFAG